MEEQASSNVEQEIHAETMCVDIYDECYDSEASTVLFDRDDSSSEHDSDNDDDFIQISESEVNIFYTIILYEFNYLYRFYLLRLQRYYKLVVIQKIPLIVSCIIVKIHQGSATMKSQVKMKMMTPL